MLSEGEETRTCKNDASRTETRAVPRKESNANQKAKDGTEVGAGASAACADKAITGMTNNMDLPGSAFGMLTFKSTKQTKRRLRSNGASRAARPR